MGSSEPIADPLMFGAMGESDVDEEVPIDDEPLPTLGGPMPDAPFPPTAAVPAATAAPAAAARPLGGDPSDDPLQTTRADAVASYGQLVAPAPGGSFGGSYDGGAGSGPGSSAAGEPHDAGALPFASGGEGEGEIRAASAGDVRDVPESSGAAGGGDSRGRVALLKIAVSDPIKKIEQSIVPGMSGGYVTYKVDSSTNLPNYTHRTNAVRRRFRDFVALADLLAATHRGYFIPPRPDKNAVEGQRASAEFVEMRREHLEKYLQRLAEHPVIARSEELRVFLEGEGQLGACFQWQQLQPLSGSTLEGLARLPKQVFGSERAIPMPSEAAQSTSRTSDLLRRFKELGVSMKAEYKRAASVTLDEATLRGQTSMVEDFQETLAGASRKAEKLVKKFEEYGNVLGDLGLSLIKVAKFEDEDGAKTGMYTDSGVAARQLSADTRRVGMAAVRLSRLSRSAVGQAAASLGALHEELGLTPSVLRALREREGQLLTVNALGEDLDKRRRGIAALEDEGNKVLGGDKSKTRKVTALQNEAAALEAAVGAAEAEYEKVKGRNKEELSRWATLRSEEFAEMLGGYGRVQSAFAERSLSIWLGVAEEFGASSEVARLGHTA